MVECASKRFGISREEAENRLAGQINDEEKASRADIVIVNDGSIEELKDKVASAWKMLITR